MTPSRPSRRYCHSRIVATAILLTTGLAIAAGLSPSPFPSASRVTIGATSDHLVRITDGANGLAIDPAYTSRVQIGTTVKRNVYADATTISTAATTLDDSRDDILVYREIVFEQRRIGTTESRHAYMRYMVRASPQVHNLQTRYALRAADGSWTDPTTIDLGSLSLGLMTEAQLTISWTSADTVNSTSTLRS